MARITEIKPRVLTFDRDNRVAEVLAYSVERNRDGCYGFSILDGMDGLLTSIGDGPRRRAISGRE